MKLVKQTESSVDQMFIWYTLFGLLMLVGGLNFLLSSGSSDGFTDSSSNSKRMLTLLAIYMVSLGFLVLLPSKRAFDIAAHPLLLLIIFLPMVSVIWSYDPELSGKRSVAHALTLVFILAVASRLTMEEFFRALMIVLTITAVVSVFVIVAMPGTGVSQGGPNVGSWHGGTGHKANMGRLCTMALLVSIFFPTRGDVVMQRMRWTCILIFGVILIGTQSRIAWGTTAAGITAGLVFKIMRWQALDVSVRAIVFFAGFLAVAIPAVLLFEQAIYASGRDLTFSGRTNLWESAIAVAQTRHPFAGAGYGAFWTKNSAIDVLRYMQHWGHMPSHGHNGYVDAWLEMGWVGLATLVTVTVVTFATIVTRMNDPRNGDYWFILMILHVVFLAINVGGTISFKHSEIYWIFFLAPLFFRLHHLNSTDSDRGSSRIPRPDQYYAMHARRPTRAAQSMVRRG